MEIEKPDWYAPITTGTLDEFKYKSPATIILTGYSVPNDIKKSESLFYDKSLLDSQTKKVEQDAQQQIAQKNLAELETKIRINFGKNEKVMLAWRNLRAFMEGDGTNPKKDILIAILNNFVNSKNLQEANQILEDGCKDTRLSKHRNLKFLPTFFRGYTTSTSFLMDLRDAVQEDSKHKASFMSFKNAEPELFLTREKLNSSKKINQNEIVNLQKSASKKA